MRRAWPVACFLLLAVLLRLAVLHRSVLDWDESLYVLMARDWLAGHLPYSRIWDNKPPGIYAMFAVFQAIIPGIAAIRIASSLCLGLEGWAVRGIVMALGGRASAGWAAGLLALLAGLSNDGLSANTEPFMACCVALAVLCVLRGGPAWLAGLGLGAGVMVKYVCAPEALLVLALLWRLRGTRAALAGLLGAALPPLAAALLYLAAGRFGLLWDDAILANLRRAGVPFSWAQARFAAAQQAGRWGMLYLAALAGLLTARGSGPRWFLPLWLLASLLGALSAKSFYDHYFLELLPPLCVAAGLALARLPWRMARALAALAIAAQLSFAAWQAFAPFTGPDSVRAAARLIRAAAPNSLYVFDSQPILYALTGLTPPTRFVLPSELTGRTLPGVARVNPAQEVARILAQRPQIIATHSWPPDPATTDPDVYTELQAALAAHYRLWAHVPGINLFLLRPGP
nr:hypothetical protein [uncultured Acidocella sp.]